MCGGSKLGYLLGNLIYIVEKLASWCAVTAVVTCLITTLILMLAFGIGLGYNYCFVDFKTRHDASRESSTYTTTRPTIPIMRAPAEIFEPTTEDVTTRSIKKPPGDTFQMPPLKRRFSVLRQKIKKTDRTTSKMPIIKRTMVVPLDVDVDVSSLLSKIRALKKNVTLEIIAP